MAASLSFEGRTGKERIGACGSKFAGYRKGMVIKMKIHETARIARGAIVYGDVELKEKSSIWYNAVIRGDRGKICLGSSSNIQDNATVHTDEGYEVCIGNQVTVGHGAILHGCTVRDRCLIGMGAIILNGAVIEEDCIIGAGAIITRNKIIPAGSMAVGNPGQVVRRVTDQEKEEILHNALHYLEEKMEG